MIQKRHLHIITFLFTLWTLAPIHLFAQNDCVESVEDSTSLAQKNKALGFNDTINRLAEDFVNVYLVIAEPGAKLYSVVGHACLRLQCKTFDLDYMYTYESEDVHKKILSFLSGNLKMGMFAIKPAEYISSYANSNRGVVQYKLTLPAETELHLWQVLDMELMRGAHLSYDYLKRGCAQSILHFLTIALRGDSITYGEWTEKYNMTRREFVSSNLDNHPWADVIFGLVVGTDADKEVSESEKVVIPTDLVEILKTAQINGTHIITEEPQQLAEPHKKSTKGWCTPMLCVGILLLVLIISAWGSPSISKIADIICLTLITFIGTFIAYTLLLSTLPNTNWNWLIIPFNPLLAILWRWRKYWAIPYAIIVVTWILGMCLYPHTLVNNTYIALAICEIILLTKQMNVKFLKRTRL